MPVFTFEKISPPIHRVSTAEAEKPRGVILQILDRFVEPRSKRASDDPPGQPRQTKPPQ